MGRIDEALRRSNVDAARGTGAPPPRPSPWVFESHENWQEAHRRSGAPPPVERPAGAPGTRLQRWPDGVPAAGRLVVSKNAEPLLVERFRSLAATLHQAQREQHVRSVIVTSPTPGDGKTYVAVNLALTLSDSFQGRVLLMDADLRRPSLHRVFDIPNAQGLSDALRTSADQAPAMQITDTLTLLPAGPPEPNPLGGLASSRMKDIVDQAVSRFDWVIVDAPPVGVLADGRLICEMVDAAILVVRAGVTRLEDLEAAAGMVGRDRILGIVLNAVAPTEIRGRDYYRHYYGAQPSSTPPGA